MKPLFGFEKRSKQPAYAVKYITKSLTTELEKEYNEKAQVLYNIKRKMENKFRWISDNLIWISVALIFVSFISLVRYDILTTLRQNMVLLIIAGVLLLSGIALKIVSAKYKPSKKLEEDLEWANGELLKWEEKRDEYFAFPENKKNVDILVPYYNEKNGEIKDRNLMGLNVNLPTIFYCDEQYLYISDNLSVYQFARKNIKSFVKLESRTPFMYWNQKDNVDSEQYRQMGIQKNKPNGFTATTRGRVVLDFEEDGEYYFDVLPYDYHVVADFLGIELENFSHNMVENNEDVVEENKEEQSSTNQDKED